MISLLYYISVFHNKYKVGITNCWKPVCNDKTRASFHKIIHSFLYLYLGSCINRRGCFIKDKYLIVRKNCSRYRKKLLLSLWHIACIFVKFHLVTARKCLNKVMCSRRFCRCDYFLVCRIKSSVTDIFHYRSFKKPGVLKHHSKCVAEFTPVKIFYIAAV